MDLFQKIGNLLRHIPKNPFELGKLYKDVYDEEKRRNKQAKELAGTTRWTSRFYDGYTGLNSKEQEEWKKEHEEYENTVAKKHPNATEEQRNKWRNNKFKQEIIKNFKNESGRELQSVLFDDSGKIKDKSLWKNIDNLMATLSQEADFDGISDRKERWKKQDAFIKIGQGMEGLANSQETSMREAATEYLNKTNENSDVKNLRQNIFDRINSNTIDGNGKTRSERVADADNLFQSVSQDYEMTMNPEKYKLLQNYRRFKDTEVLRFKDDNEKLQWYAQYLTDAQRGGEKYARKRLQDRFAEKMAENQEWWEMIGNAGVRFQDDVWSTGIGTLGLLDGLTGQHLSKWLGVTGSEEDQKRRQNQSYWQGIFDNPWVQYSQNLMETHVWDTDAQREMMKYHLNDAELYETGDQQESIISIPKVLGLVGDYGFTAGMTFTGGALSQGAKLIPRAAKLFGKMATSAKNVESLNTALKVGMRSKDVVNFFNACLVGSTEGAQVTLGNKIEHYNQGLQDLQSKFAEVMIYTHPNEAATLLQYAGVEGIPSGKLVMGQEGFGTVQYSNDDIQQMLEIAKENPEIQRQLAGAYESIDPETVAAEYQTMKDIVESSAALEFAFQMFVNGATNITLKKTLQIPGIQRSMARVKNRLGINTASIDDNVEMIFEDGVWKAKPKQITRWDIAKERLKESGGEMVEEYSQNVGGGISEGYFTAAYEDYVNKTFGDEGHINTAVDLDLSTGLAGAIKGIENAAISDEALMDGIYGGLSSSIGGFNLNTNWRSKAKSGKKNEKSGNKLSNLVNTFSDNLPIVWRGAWTPFISSNERDARQAANNRLAEELNTFFSNKEVQQKLNSAHGAATFLNEYQQAIASNKEFYARNAKFGSIFSVANMLSKLDGTEYHKALTKSLDIREAFGDMTDEQIKEALNSDEDNEVKKALIEFKTEPDNMTGDANQDRTVNDSQENVDIVRQIAQNAKEMKETLSEINTARKQVEKDFAGSLDEDAMDAMVYQQLSINNKKKRRKSINDEFQQVVSFDAESQANNESRAAIAKYGNLEVLQTEKKELEKTRDGFVKQVQENEAAYKKLLDKQQDHKEAVKQNGGKENEETKKLALTANEQADLAEYEKALQNLARMNAELKIVEREEKALDKAVKKTISKANDSAEATSTTPVLNEREIMEMGAAERAFMLDEKHKLNSDGTNRYSAEQQKIIDRLNEKGRETVTDWDRKIQDAAHLQQAITLDLHSQNVIMQNSNKLKEFVRNAKVTKMERVKTQKWEPIFVDAEQAVANYNENNPESVEARTQALHKLAEFLNEAIPNGDVIDGLVRIKLSRKYGNSQAMQILNAQEKEIHDFAKTMDSTNVVSYSEEQQPDDSSVNSYMRHNKEYKMSDEDLTLLTYALAYANNHGLTLDEVPDIIKTEEFQEWLRNRNKENENKEKSARATEVTPDNAELFSNVFRGAIDYHRALIEKRREKEAKRQEELDKVKPAQSTTPKEVPIVPQDERKSQAESEQKSTDEFDYNKELLSPEIQELSRTMQIQLKELLDAINRMTKLYDKPIDKKAKVNILKEIINLAKSKRYTSIDGLKAELQRTYSNKRVDDPLRLLANVVKGIKVSSEDTQSEENQPQGGIPFILESQGLEFILSHEGSPLADYIQDHNVVDNFITIKDAIGRGETMRVAFVYDPMLGDAVQESMEKQGLAYNEKTSAPIIIAVPITEEQAKKLGVDFNSERLIDASMNNFNHGAEKNIKYLPIGIMPDNNATNITSASNMAGIREHLDTGIDYSKTDDTKNIHPDNYPRVLRYRVTDGDGKPKTFDTDNAKGMPKENGTRIMPVIRRCNGSTEDRPSGASNVERRSVIELTDENIADKKRAIVQNISDKDRAEYEDAKQKAEDTKDRKVLRSTAVYKAVRSKFISMLDKITKTVKRESGDEKDISQLVYLLNKNTDNVYPKTIFIKPISETHHRDNPDRLITKILQEFSDTNDNSAEIIGTGNYGDKGANSKLASLFYVLEKFLNETNDKNESLNWPLKCFDETTGELKERRQEDYANTMESLAKEIQEILSSKLSIRKEGKDATIKVEIDKDKPLAEKNMTISVVFNNKPISTITLKYGEKFDGKHFMQFLKDLILEDPNATDEAGNPKVRMDGKYEVVKWHVNYQDAVTANKNLTNKETARMSQEEIKAFNERKERATRALEDVYDDDILTLRLDKLAYTPTTVTLTIDNVMNRVIYKRGVPEPKSPTGTSASDTKSGDGTTVDNNSGLPGKTPTALTPDGNESILDRITRQVAEIIEKSKRRILTDDEGHYQIGTKLYARVTTVKNILTGKLLRRFDNNSEWKLPSTSIGNSFDEFARDVFNGIYDGMNENELRKEFESNYSNATVEHYMKAYRWIKAFKDNLTSEGVQIVKTLDLDDGGIVAAGEINVPMRDGTVLQLDTAGTIDLLVVDASGNYHIYDFKTYRTEEDLNAESAADKGYDRQLSMYAEFLEKEFGITVESINIIPCHVDYGAPGTLMQYRKKDPNSLSNQLEISTDGGKTFHDFNGANFEVKPVIPITRLRGERLEASYENMTQEERENVAQALSDKYGRTINAEDIGKPESQNRRPTEPAVQEEPAQKEQPPVQPDNNMLTEEQAEKLIDEAEAKLEKPAEQQKPTVQEEGKPAEQKRRRTKEIAEDAGEIELGKRQRRRRNKNTPSKPSPDTKVTDSIIQQDEFEQSDKDEHERNCRRR